MKPAFSVLFLTTLIGAGQGLVLALVLLQLLGALPAGHALYLAGAAVAVLLTALGLVASFFHLGHPERAWRAAAGWRTSWLSREVIVLPGFLGATALWGLAHWAGHGSAGALGVLAALLAVLLYVCTGMIYAAVRAIAEWASPLTVLNYTLLGQASGTTLAAALAAWQAPELAPHLAQAAIVLTLLAAAARAAALWRNARLRPKTTLQTAIGIRHPKIVQKAQGAMGGSFNTREFFHGAPPGMLITVLWSFAIAAFVAPLLLLGLGAAGSAAAVTLAFVVQYLGLLAERWHFFAQANHTQNLYYRSVA